MGPVLIRIQRDHAYKNRGKGKNGCGFTRLDGSTCMKSMGHVDHLGIPMSLNVALSSDIWAYRGLKHGWQEEIIRQIGSSDLPAGWESVYETKLVYDRKLKEKVMKPVEVERIQTRPDAINSVTIEGRVCFPIMPTVGRDQDNFRWFLAKCAGDALVEGGWLKEDTIYPERRYEFGSLEIIFERGQAWSEMLLYAS